MRDFLKVRGDKQ